MPTVSHWVSGSRSRRKWCGGRGLYLTGDTIGVMMNVRRETFTPTGIDTKTPRCRQSKCSRILSDTTVMTPTLLLWSGRWYRNSEPMTSTWPARAQPGDLGVAEAHLWVVFLDAIPGRWPGFQSVLSADER